MMPDKTYPNWKQFLFLVFLYFLIQFIYTFIAIMPKAYGWQQMTTYDALVRLASSPFCLIPLIIFVSIKSKIPITWSLKRPPVHLFLLMVILAIAIRIIVQPLVIPVEYFGNLIDGRFKLLRFVVPEFDFALAIKFITIVFMAPVFEEIFWRKQIFGLFLNKLSPVVSIVLSSALFALWHRQLDIIGFLFILGLLFCLVYYLTNSIELSILLHSFVNLSGIFIKHRYITINYYTQFFNTIALMVICGAAIYLIIKYLWRNMPIIKIKVE